MPAVSSTNVIPTATMAIGADWTRMLRKFSTARNLGLRQAKVTTTRAYSSHGALRSIEAQVLCAYGTHVKRFSPKADRSISIAVEVSHARRSTGLRRRP